MQQHDELDLREIHHRVRNTLQKFGDLLSLRATGEVAGEQAAFQAAATRIFRAAPLHEQITGALWLTVLENIEIVLKDGGVARALGLLDRVGLD